MENVDLPIADVVSDTLKGNEQAEAAVQGDAAVQEEAVVYGVQQMTNGVVNLFEKDFNEIRTCLNEARTKQNKLQIELEHLNKEHAEESRQDCQDLFTLLKVYKDKLQSIKKQMINIHLRVRHLKKRADNLERFRDRELNALRQKQLHEEALIAKSTRPSK